MAVATLGDATVIMAPSEVLEQEQIDRARSFAKSSAIYQAQMYNLVDPSVVYFEQTTPVEGVGYAHLFGWYIPEEVNG